ncbi:hypothetical protein ACQPZP_02545 [Spirillospora sp. CA-142024]|uniref:hypothetical protein n=1 Tax=Spirillospora sp. CA-142024 TaxID=3240036 RepID=UPI003D928B5E
MVVRNLADCSFDGVVADCLMFGALAGRITAAPGPAYAVRRLERLLRVFGGAAAGP